MEEHNVAITFLTDIVRAEIELTHVLIVGQLIRTESQISQDRYVLLIESDRVNEMWLELICQCGC